MTSLIVKDNFQTCKEVLTVAQNNVIVGEYPCVRERGHKGLHQHTGGPGFPGGTWATHKSIQSIVENEGRSL